MTIEDYLAKNAELYPDKVVVVCGEERCTYKELWHKVAVKSHDYDGREIIPFRFTPSVESLATYFAIHQANSVAVPLDKDLPEPLFQNFKQELQQVTVPEGTADILYTTGTTGKSKGVIISHDTIVANTENLVDRLEYTPDLTFIINGPLNHIGSLSKIYPVIYTGGTLYIINGMKDIKLFFDAIDKAPGKVATFLVPTSIRMLLQMFRKDLAVRADKIDFIEAGAAPLFKADMENLMQVLPDSRLYNTYASTETGIIASYNYNGDECIENCLGTPMKHSQITIGEGGQIICSGRTLMTGYVNDKKLTDSVLRDGKIYTADIGEIDEKGRLHLKGRKGDVINVGGFKVSPVEVESVALMLPYIKDCICINANHPLLGNCMRLLFTSDSKINIREIAEFMKEHLEPYKLPTYFKQVDSIKRTFNGKLDRKAYVES